MNYPTIVLLCLAFALAESSVSRNRRASDSTTEVIGLALQEGATAEDAKTLKKEAKGSKARGKRQIGEGLKLSGPLGSISYGKKGAEVDLGAYQINTQASPEAANPTESAEVNLGAYSIYSPAIPEVGKPTETQKTFLKITFDFDLAIKLKDAVSSNPILSKMVVVNEKGVTCDEVCRQANNGFGTIGICTSKYCTCGAYGALSKDNCEGADFVFDILERKCAKPEDTILCSDDE